MTNPACALVPFSVRVVALLLFSACLQDRSAAESKSVAQDQPTTAPGGADAIRASSGVATDAANLAKLPPKLPAAQRKLIQSVDLQLVVTRFAPFRAAIDQLVARAGGFVASSDIRHDRDRVSSGEFVLRLPASGVGAALDEIRRLGSVVFESARGEDITEQYFDVDSRLRNAHRTEQRLITLLTERAASLKDIVEVEREVARVRETIEVLEGKKRLWDSQVDLTTMSLRFAVEERYPAGQPTLARAFRAARGSLATLVDLGQGGLVAGAALIPWSPLVLLIGFGLRRSLRGRRRPVAPPRS